MHTHLTSVIEAFQCVITNPMWVSGGLDGLTIWSMFEIPVTERYAGAVKAFRLPGD